MTQLPTAFVEEMRAVLGEELSAYLATMEETPCRGLRLNPLKRPETLPQSDLEGEIPWEKEGRYLKPESRLGAVALHEAGAWYLQ